MILYGARPPCCGSCCHYRGLTKWAGTCVLHGTRIWGVLVQCWEGDGWTS